MSIPGSIPSKRRWKRGGAVVAGVGLVAGVLAAQSGPFAAQASSHREAPLIAGDPRADNTDVYAFVSPDKPDTVTMIANWIPFEEPNGGPNFYPFAEDTKYKLNIDNNGDAVADVVYTWTFSTVVRDPANFLYNTGQVTSLTDTDLNVYQTYDLVETDGAGGRTVLLGDGLPGSGPNDPIVAPSSAGLASMPDYATLRAQASVPFTAGSGTGASYAGQADDPFFADLRVFDLLYGANASEVGTDTLAGYNVNSVALQIPKSALAINGNATTNPVIGIWSTTDRRNASVVDPTAPNAYVQVSRLGNPLVNEVVVPANLKDAFNSIPPAVDASVTPVVNAVLDPLLPKLVDAIYHVPAPTTPRNDLFEIFLQGISKANAGPSGDPAVVLNVDLNSQDLNADAQTSRGTGVPFRPSEMLRLNMAVPPAANPSPYGVLAGDVAGFPNGRRLADDVLDIEVQAAEGAAQAGALVKGLAVVDSVDRNDKAFTATFPYLALPHQSQVNLGVDRAPRPPEFVPVNPQRVLETRTTETGGQIGYTGATPAGGQVLTLKVAGVAGVPANATTAFLNITAVNTGANGFVTVYPCGTTRPTASNFNPVAGLITHNLVAAKIGTGGNVCIYTNSSTDLIADLAGYHPGDAKYIGVQPERLLETRTTEGGQIGYTGAKPAAGSTVTLDVTKVGVAQVPNDAKAVFLNVVTTNSDNPGFVTVYPCGTTKPLASNITMIDGVVRANLVSAKIGADGNVCLYSNQGTDLVVDLEGYAPADSQYVPVSPERVLETRASEGQVNYSASKPVAGQTTEVKVTGFGSSALPATAGTVMLNVTVTDTATAGFVTVFPCGSARPTASNINFTGLTTTALVAAKIGDGGRVCIYNSAGTNLAADITGYFPGASV